MTAIDISGLSKAEILAALYNTASPNGYGFVHFEAASQELTVADAAELLKRTTVFDYVRGRSFKVDLTGDMFETWLYDRDNGGEGTAERIIGRLRDTGAISSKEGRDHQEAVIAQRAYEQPAYAELGESIGPYLGQAQRVWRQIVDDGLPEYDPTRTSRQHLDWLSNLALAYFDKGELDKSLMLFMQLVTWHPGTKWIATHPFTEMVLSVGFMSGSHEQLERAMKGFAAM